MTLDCPFCNPLQSRVISVRSCYLTSYGYLSFCRIATCHTIFSSLPEYCSQPFPLAASAALSSYVRSCMLESVRSTLWVVCASPCVESSVYSDRMWSPVLLSWVRVPCLTLRFLSFGQGSCFDTAPCFRPALCVCRFLFHDGRPHVRPCIPSSGAGALLKTLDSSFLAIMYHIPLHLSIVFVGFFKIFFLHLQAVFLCHAKSRHPQMPACSYCSLGSGSPASSRIQR